MNARFFGETPQLPYSGTTSLIDLTKSKGYATITVCEDTVFGTLTFAHPQPSAANLAGKTFPVGFTIYGVRAFQVTSGAGIAYLSNNPL